MPVLLRAFAFSLWFFINAFSEGVNGFLVTLPLGFGIAVFLEPVAILPGFLGSGAGTALPRLTGRFDDVAFPYIITSSCPSS
jgi:hypothetical protein